MKKHYYLIVDTETTQKQTVADFGAVIMDRKGAIVEQFAVLLNGHFGKLPLFAAKDLPADAFFSKQTRARRLKHYEDLLDAGQRSICSPTLVNIWLSRILGQYKPVLTAYNISFDFGKCRNTGIDLGIFSQKFCLMKAAKNMIGTTTEYVDWCKERNLWTKKRTRVSMTADTMAKFIARDAYNALADEPHTALEDARDYEAMILASLLKNNTRKTVLEAGQ
tara:strand:- start:435 stop:1097 length:663 start_codon:yes stop_codon:yes gene_type:complete